MPAPAFGLVPGAMLRTLAAFELNRLSQREELDAMVSTVLSWEYGARDPEQAPLVSREGERAVVWLAGEHDIATVAVLADTLANVVSADDADVIVDLSGVTFMSTATIDELLRGRNFLLRQSRTLTVRSPSRCARRLLDCPWARRLIEPSR